MPFVPAKCTSCGAAIDVDDGLDSAFCAYCGTRFITKQAINNNAQPPPQNDNINININLGGASTNSHHDGSNAFVNFWTTGNRWDAKHIIVYLVIFAVTFLAIFLPTFFSLRDLGDIGGSGGSGAGGGGSSGDGSGSNTYPTISTPMNPMEFNGTGDSVVTGINLHAGHFYARFSHAGTGNFIVRFSHGTSSSSLLNLIGVQSGYTLLSDFLRVPITNGALEIRANGAWTITIFEISRFSERNLQGTGHYVSGLIGGLSGRRSVSLTHNGSGNFIVRLYRYGGGTSGNQSIVNRIGVYQGDVMANFSAFNFYFFWIRANGDWTLSIN